MKLLVITQIVNREDPILGFFHHWLEVLAAQVEHVEVVCLSEGAHNLPENVRVHSLGKQGMRASRVFERIRYAVRFKKLAWELRNDYDTVLVHMNPEYLLVGGVFWRMWGKRVRFWYNHTHKGIRFTLAAFFAQKIFYTSPYAAPAHLTKAVRMPVGIDTKLFAPRPVSKIRNAFYMQGRIMPSKRVHVALHALRLLLARGVPATLALVGPEIDVSYGKKLREDFADLVKAEAVFFHGPCVNEETPARYSAHGVAINLAPAGCFDKTALEPMACETPVVVSSPAFADLVPPEWIVPPDDPQALSYALERLMKLPEAEYKALAALERARVVEDHSLDALIISLVLQLENA